MKKYSSYSEYENFFENHTTVWLPNFFKKTGIGITILCLIGLFYATGMFFQFLKYGILVGLLIISVSKEKIEDELIEKIRMRAYSVSFITSIVGIIFMTFSNYFIDVFLNKNVIFVDFRGDIVLGFFLVNYILHFTSFKGIREY